MSSTVVDDITDCTTKKHRLIESVHSLEPAVSGANMPCPAAIGAFSWRKIRNASQPEGRVRSLARLRQPLVSVANNARLSMPLQVANGIGVQEIAPDIHQCVFARLEETQNRHG